MCRNGEGFTSNIHGKYIMFICAWTPDPCRIDIGNASAQAEHIGIIDSQLNMVSHVNHINRTCYVHLRNIRQTQPNLTEDSDATLVHAFMSSKLDNENSLMYGVLDKVIRKISKCLYSVNAFAYR